MRKIFLFFASFILIVVAEKTNAQGCVALKSNGGFCTMSQHHQADSAAKWMLIANNRYFKSYKHFVGTDEQKQRTEQGTNVINHQYTLDLTVLRILNPRWSLLFDLPIEINSRSSLYEHSNVGRFTTHSAGIGDMRLAAYYWLLNPEKMPRGDVQLGLGVKLPTGKYNVQDNFHTSDSTTRLGPVDQSIQLGDGGFGVTFELNAFYDLSTALTLYGNVYYLANPREQNGVSTARGGTPSSGAVANGSYVMSVPDQYLIRAGITMAEKRFIFSLGVRDECLTVHDWIGGSNGFRRPGYIISVEPGIIYRVNKLSLYAFVPVAIVRNRTQSVPDMISSGTSGKNVHGDAAFSDYAVNLGVTLRF
ncbi:MAG TPA: hypothetical protein VGH64_13550 [Puia sp.]|jgi:hypothetical protein